MDDVWDGMFGKRKAEAASDARIDAVKRKARTLIDVAYNRAINDVLAAVGDELQAESKKRAMALRREVRR